MTLDTRWFPGDELTFVWDGGILMLDVSLDDAELSVAVDRIWAGLAGDLTLGGVLQLLTDVLHASLLSLPDFAVALYEGAAGQFAARGRFMVDVGRLDGPVSVVGAGVTTWSERAVEGIQSVTVGLPTAPAEVGLPLQVGVVKASRVSWGTATAPIPVVPEPGVHLIDDPVASSGEDPTPDAPQAITPPDEIAGAATIAGSTDAEELPAPHVPAAGEASLTTVVSSERDGEAEAATLVADADGESADAVSEAAPSNESRYAAMWGDTVAHSIEEAAVRLEEDEPVKVAAAPAALITAPGPTGHEAFAPAPGLAEEPLLISGVPGRTSSAAPPRQSTPQAWSDHDGETVVGFSLGAPAPAAPQQAVDPEKVLALVCLSGHANRPHRTECKDCGANLSGAITETVSRPPLGTIRSTTGELLHLTGPVLIGRSPRASRFQGTVSPQLLSLPYPHISSTHLEIRLEGWNAFAVDLNSMNGAYLRRRDEPPVRITHTPLMLADGDVIDFGHGVSVNFEGMP